MRRKTMTEKIQELAKSVEGDPYPGYSGRFMFGRRCWGVSCSWSQTDRLLFLARKLGLKYGRIDDMGLDAIVYWPSAEYKEKP